MANLDLVEYLIPRRVAIIGLPGSGKSTLVAQLATNFKLDWIDLENAGELLTKPELKHLRPNINYCKLPDSAAFPVASQTLLQIFKAGKGKFCFQHGVVDCQLCKKNANAIWNEVDFNSYGPQNICVIDTATQLGYSILAHLTKNKPVDYKPERDDWGGARKYTEFFASQWQAFPGNLIVIFHLAEAELEDGRKKLVPQFGSGNMSAAIAAKFSHVIYMEVVNKKHKAFSSSTASNSVVTKSRTDWEIEKLAEPSLFPLFEPMLSLAPPENSVVTATTIDETTIVVTKETQKIPAQESKVIDIKIANTPGANAIKALQAKYKKV